MGEASVAFPIVGIGASAGGVEALEHFFKGLPADSGCSFVIVTHLSPDRPSLLAEIVSRFTSMPVYVAAEGTVPQPDQVYVLPADAILGIENRTLSLRKPNSAKRERKPVDIFLSQLARDIGEYAVGVILSGGDGDGTLGIKAIKERGGFTLAQTWDGTEPQYMGMPQSAIASGMIDVATPVQEMGRSIVEFARSFGMLERLEVSGAEDGQRLLRAARADICALLRNQIGHDFSGYKEKSFLRRVQRRMHVNHIDTLEAYAEKLRHDPKEIGALFRDLLINVTNFFRDADAFEVLEKSVIPKLFAGRGADDTVRVWVPGCATGEEVFSIAILMREYMDTLSAVPRVQIFATDIDELALSVARAARYPEALLDSVSAARRKRFFTAEDGSYLLTKDVRELCVFSSHSVIRDPPFSRLDLISCRNLLIYFGPEVQNQVIMTFHYALRPGGYLFLGTSENVTQFSDFFVALDKKQRVFRRREGAPSHARVPLVASGLRPAPFAMLDRRGRGLGGMVLRQTVEAQVLDRFAPAHVVVNRDGDVVYYSPRTGKYLEATAGVPTRQILAMARKGLRLDLRTLLREAIETEQRVIRQGVSVETEEGQIQIVNLSVEPLAESSGEDRLFLLVFADVGKLLSREEGVQRATAPDETAAHLERELRESRERLQSLIEEYETALEELKSSNEELVSVNEELQSTNEELESSKEELQSVNEELHTVNAELNGKVEMLDRSNSDLTNLFESTRVATVFLDRNLVIRSYTPAVSQIFNILPTDRGRPLTDLSSRFSLPTLADDVREVFNSGKSLERTVVPDGNGTYFLLRLAPYRDQSAGVEGVVLTFVDVTSLTRAEQHQRRLIAELNHRVKNMLAIVIAIAEQTYRTAGDPATFKVRLVERIRGMARSYELLSHENWHTARVEELVRKHLEPFGMERVNMGQIDIRLPPRQALSLGMILHELATNASKYGALGTSQGRIGIEWREEHAETPAIAFHWREIGGPKVAKPAREGFGVKLIRQEAIYALRGCAHIEFKPEGLDVVVRFPREELNGDG
ncbi:MAG TPA: CheR family methyltransferase [Rhizomicrobium sp.]|nr:CheR family methyltransferase [Rhizomicrobium sp.]